MALAVLAALGGSVSLALEMRLFPLPLPAPVRSLAWALGQGEAAYDFEVVVPGRIFRSGRPDARLIRHLHEQRGLDRVVSLAGPAAAHATARALGMQVTVLDWPASHLPAHRELEALVESLAEGGPVLVHGDGAGDRTGYAIATWRVRYEGWSVERAVAELGRGGHGSAGLERELRELLGEPSAVASGPPAQNW